MRIGIAIVLLVAGLSAHAAIYKWTDNKGHVHYGDKPGGASNAEQLNVDTSNTGIMPDDASRDEKRQRLLDAIQEDRQEKEQQRTKRPGKKGIPSAQVCLPARSPA